ncbi:MAG: putative nitrogen fixation protein NifT [Acetobacter sp.]|jgi:nitrogen fixation protein NifT|uniref:Putative nitrogen fixation protein NifT n=1 Tax=Acetobacter peroxydans TaxID=104098 RepID=A0A4Y3TUL4_9PROT|nr:putative nitrogen fixation protein NifT [Acetobacter peroxydans]NHO16137.1 putative nitrogen fixation protein NifT [Acetobacter peroxydans]GBR34898.1 nitrogen fixation protein [Acetobacter peroxydans NBRC 13755]GBR40514.1 nitrogen fixation protein [Acetobacter peroxydans]GEB86126.1 putative nitrogen fixation protein NifT [Acetobacter peroxydans]
MKVMLRRNERGLSVYVPKKDLEQPVMEQQRETLWGGWVRLKNGWVLELPALDEGTRLPVTVEARRIDGGSDA